MTTAPAESTTAPTESTSAPAGSTTAPAAAAAPTGSTASAGTAFAVSDAFLAAADEAGLLHRPGGLTLVAGPYQDPLTAEWQCLVEHADPALLADPAGLLATLRELFPDCTSAVVRVPGGLRPELLEPQISYLHRPADAPAPPAPAAPGPEVRESDGSHDHLVRGWLARAIGDAQQDRGEDADPDAVRRAVEEIMAAPGRRTWLVHVDGHPAPAGHATVVTDAFDDVSGADFVDLVDILIDPPAVQRSAQAALVAVCAAVAAERGLPLVGNVCHHGGPGPEPGAAVVAALRAHGWQPSYQYCRAALR
ncbi:hypothetical protein [Kitasatospora sp. LaBMicrA B282]|uniref:hypothetical protein n=1 Tax=Kitasatospora sp. LaBMicrA B282 TaxID=3420949 RepID=UPI003D112520